MNRMLIVGAAAAALALCALQPAQAGQTLRLMHFFSAQQLTSKTDQAFADAVAAKTNGALKIKIYWAGALGKATEVLNLVGSGAVDMGATVPAYFPAQMPLTGVASSLINYMRGPDTALKVVQAISKDPAGKAELKRANLVPLLIHGLLPYHLICTKPIAKLSDLQGVKVRTFGAFAPAAIEALGAVPVNLQTSEIYEGLQRGTVDCAMYNYDFAVQAKFQEVAKYWSTISFGSFAGYQLYINAGRFAGLSPEIRSILVRAGQEQEQAELAKLKAVEDDDIAKAKAAGVTFVRFEDQDAFNAKIPDILDLWAKKTIKSGVPKIDVDRIAKLIRTTVGK